MPNKIFDKSFNRVRTVYGADEVLFVQLGDRIEVQLRDEFRHADVTDTRQTDDGVTHTLAYGSTVDADPTGAVSTPPAPVLEPVPVPMPTIEVPPPHASQPPTVATSLVANEPATATDLPASDTPPASEPPVSNYDAGYQLGLSGQTLADDAPDEAKRGYSDAVAAQNSPLPVNYSPDYNYGIDLAKDGIPLPPDASADTTKGYNDTIAGRA